MTEPMCLPKINGCDTELGNFIHARACDPAAQTDAVASRLLLRQINGLPERCVYGGYGGRATGAQPNPQDWGRKYLMTNGGCAYIDLNHLELCTPEVRSAREHQAAWSAMLRIARNAQIAANEALAGNGRVVLLANNSDRQGHSYGGHHSFLIKRSAWDQMIRHRMYPSLFFLMAHQVSSIVYTGQGKVGSENGKPRADYQISQRADFIETLLGEQTTYNRPLVNTRDEPLCGGTSAGLAVSENDHYARLHVIFYDTNLAPVTVYLKVGVMQLVLTLIEADRVDRALLLDDPLAALQDFSADPQLNARARLQCGERLTAVQIQFRILDLAKRAAADGLFDDIVPDAAHIIAVWEDTLNKLHARSFEPLLGRIDWLMKRALIDKALRNNPSWTWDSPQVVHMDQIYSSLDPHDSLFFALNDSGMFETVGTDADIEQLDSMPPETSRAWVRTMLLRAAGPRRVISVDWDHLKLRADATSFAQIDVRIADPLQGTRSQCEALFTDSDDLTGLIARLQRAGAVTLNEPGAPNASGALSLLDSYDSPYVN